MDNKEISLQEIKLIQLDMLQEIHDFCMSNGIRYSLAFGTLLGAIRHKGYIPWDDDVDLIMPLPDMLLFKKKFDSKNIKYCDVDTEKHYDLNFSRLSYIPTYRKIGKIAKSYGVNIDLYPVVALPDSDKEQEDYFKIASEFQERRHSFLKWRDRFISRFPVKTIPGFDRAMRNCRNHMLFNTPQYGETGVYYIVAIPLQKKDKVIYHRDLFSELSIVSFENRQFQIISCYEIFLKQMYGDYMQLPPESERQPYHGGNYFWKNNE